MLSFLALLFFSFAGAGSREIRVLLPRGSPTPARLQVESLDKEGQLMREEWIPLDRDRFSLTLPANSVRFRVVGGGFASRALTPSEAAALGAVSLEPTGQFRFSGLRGRSDSISVFFFPVPVTRSDRRPEPPRPDPIRERKLPRADSRPEGKLSVKAPAGLYVGRR